MIANVPSVGGRLREETLLITADVSSIVCRCRAGLAQMDISPAARPGSHVPACLELLEHLCRLWLGSILSGTFPSDANLQVLADISRRCVRGGLTLSLLMDALRLGAREIWLELLDLAKACPETRDELLFSLSLYHLEYFQVMKEEVANAFLEEECRWPRLRGAAHSALSAAVFQFPQDINGFRRTVGALGLDPEAPRTALALDVRLTATTPGLVDAELERLTLAASRQLKVAYRDLAHVLHRGRLVIWAPGGDGDTVATGHSRVVEGANALLKLIPEILGIGVGLMNQGPAGWALSAEQAFKALDQGRHGEAGRRSQLYCDMAVHECARTSENVHRYLLSLLEGLSGEPELLTTLQIYFERQQHRKLASDALGIHPNTLNYRLRRVEALLGANLSDAGWLAKLHIALTLRQRSLTDPGVTS